MLNIKLYQGDYVGDMVPNLETGSEPYLGPGSCLYAPSGAFRVVMQLDGNVVLQNVIDATLNPNWTSGAQLDPQTNDIQWNPIWWTGTDGTGTTAFFMQADGNLVAYLTVNKEDPTFSSGTNGNPGAFLRMQDDGNLVIYNTSGVALWSTGTQARTPDWCGPNFEPG